MIYLGEIANPINPSFVKENLERDKRCVTGWLKACGKNEGKETTVYAK